MSQDYSVSVFLSGSSEACCFLRGDEPEVEDDPQLWKGGTKGSETTSTAYPRSQMGISGNGVKDRTRDKPTTYTQVFGSGDKLSV